MKNVFVSFLLLFVLGVVLSQKSAQALQSFIAQEVKNDAPDNDESPFQGTAPQYERPPEPQALQDQGNLMTHPQPQVNPPGPKVHFPKERWGEDESS